MCVYAWIYVGEQEKNNSKNKQSQARQFHQDVNARFLLASAPSCIHCDICKILVLDFLGKFNTWDAEPFILFPTTQLKELSWRLLLLY